MDVNITVSRFECSFSFNTIPGFGFFVFGPEVSADSFGVYFLLLG